MNGCQWVTILGRLGCFIYVLRVPWGVLHLALHEILLGREANLVCIKPASSRFSWFAALPCRRHISHVRTPNNANLLSRLCATKLSSTLAFISFPGNEDKISKSALEDNLFWSRTDCVAGISGPYLLAPLSELGVPHVQIKGIVEAQNFGCQNFAIKGHLSLRICTERSCCSGLNEYLPDWVNLVAKHQSPRSFACWCFGPWVVWGLVHFVSWLVTGFMIFSLSAWWPYPESLHFYVNFLRKQQTPKSTCKCEIVTSLVCLVMG
jgi:hypothetical protein